MDKLLNKFMPGECGIVLKMMVEGVVRRRLFDMGLTPGADVMMRKTAPFGDPVQIMVRGYELSIRKKEAAAILMQTSEETVKGCENCEICACRQSKLWKNNAV